MENVDVFCYVDDIMMNPDGTPRTPGKSIEHLIRATKISKPKSQTKVHDSDVDSSALFKTPTAAALKKTSRKSTSGSLSPRTPNRENQTNQLAREVSKLKLSCPETEKALPRKTKASYYSNTVSATNTDSRDKGAAGFEICEKSSGKSCVPFKTQIKEEPLPYIKQEPLSPMDSDEESLPPFLPFHSEKVKKEPVDSGPSTSGTPRVALVDISNVKVEPSSSGWVPPIKIKEEIPDEQKEKMGVLPTAKLEPKPSTSKGTGRRVRKKSKSKNSKNKKQAPITLTPRIDEKVRDEAIKMVSLEEPRSKFLRSVTMSSGKVVKATFIAPRGVRFPDEVNTREIEEYHDNYQYYLARQMCILRKNEFDNISK